MKELRLRSVKRILALVLCLSFVIVLFPLNGDVSANEYEIFNCGNWWDNKQAIRISVCNLRTGVCEATKDFFYDGERWNTDGSPMKGSYETLNIDLYEANVENYEKVFCQGCKLDYLNEYYGSANGNIASMELQQVSPASLSVDKLSDDDNNVRRGLSPLWCLEASNGIYYFDDQYSFSSFLLKLDAIPFQRLFNGMGYYFYETVKMAGNIYLDPDYVIVLEPVFWFVDVFNQNKEHVFFYGSATEWAIYAQKNIGTYKATFAEGNSIHACMGTLTAVAGPLCCTPTKDTTINFGSDRTSLSFKEISEGDKDTLRKTTFNWDNRHGIGGIDVITKINKKIIEELGVDFLFPKEIYDLSIEIQNTNFFTESQGLLSFKVETNGKHELIPSYDDIINGNGYGLKLTLTTFAGSDIDPGEVTLYCDGLPGDETLTSAVTYVYDNWYTGRTAGTWKFKVEAKMPDDKKLSYKSNSGVAEHPDAENSDYIFTVNVSDLRDMILMPDDTKSDDVAPKGFVHPSGDISGYTPQLEASWITYTANAWKKPDGDEIVFLTKNEYTKSVSMDGTRPISYPNITSAFYRSGELYTKSGYGIGIDGQFSTSGDNDLSGGFQKGVVLYPELGYSRKGSLLEYDGFDSMYLEKNQYSRYYNDSANPQYSRVHFTPIWYPDGEYNIQVFMFDCWTPVGMLWDCRKYTVHIDGSMYDDWYVTRK